MRVRSSRLYWRIFRLDACLFGIVALLLLFSPITISAPIAPTQAVVVLAGLVVFDAANALLLHRALRPLDRLVERMRVVDLLRPGQRLVVERDDEVGQVVRSFNHMLDRLEVERHRSGQRLVETQEAERKAVARDLHDEVGQLLTGVLLQLRSLEIHEDNPELRASQDAVRQALDQVRRISRELRPEMLDELGLLSALRELASSFERVSGVRVTRHFTANLGPIERSTELAIYRIVQESLTNISRHAEASRVEIRVEWDERRTVVHVIDDGVGISPGAIESIGLRSMRERATLIGAAFSIADRAEGGTQVRLEVPSTSRNVEHAS